MLSLNPAITERLNNLSTGMLAGHYIFSRDFEDAQLARRYSQPDLYPHNVSFAASNDPKHIQQYYNIRQEAYRDVIGEKYYAGKDEHDEYSHMILGVAGNNCIGGIRITVSSPENHVLLPLESGEAPLKDLYDNIDFNKLTYCEASRLALLPDFRNGNYLNELFEKSTEFSINNLGVDVVFGRSGLLQTRKFQTHYRNMGFELIVRNDIIIPVPNLEHLKIQLWAIDFTPDRRYTSVLKAYNAQPVDSLEFA